MDTISIIVLLGLAVALVLMAVYLTQPKKGPMELPPVKKPTKSTKK